MPNRRSFARCAKNGSRCPGKEIEIQLSSSPKRIRLSMRARSSSRHPRSDDRDTMMTLFKVCGIAATCAVAGVLLFCTACSHPVQPVQAHILKKSELTPAEIKYGRGPKRDRMVTYQNDVVIVDQGPEAIRSAGADGFTWIIDARAGRDLGVGKIAFVTGRCVGRVLLAKREGDNLRLVLGPVELTDIFKKLDVTVRQQLDSAQGIEYGPPQIPGMTLPLSGSDAAPSDWAGMRPMRIPETGSPFPGARAPFLQQVAYALPAAQQMPGTPG